MIVEFILILFLVLLNAFFVAAEFAIVKVRPSQLEVIAATGNTRAKLALKILSNLDAYLSASQLGITIASLLLGAIGEEVLVEAILSLVGYMDLAISSDLAHNIAFVLSLTLITIMHIVFGEQAPKSLAIQQAEKVTIAVAIPLQIFYVIFRPFIWVLNQMAVVVLRWFGLANHGESDLHSAEELELLIDQGKQTGALIDTEHELIKNVFGFVDVNVRQVMTPRTSINAIDINLPLDYIINKIINEGYSRLPVYKDSIEDIIGVLYAKDLLKMMNQSDVSSIDLNKAIRIPYYVPETMKIHLLLKELQAKRLHMAIVTDEYGGVSGICTIEDIIEEIVGEIQDEHDDESPKVEQLSELEFVINAATSIIDVNEFLPVKLPESEEYDTVAGLLNTISGRIPDISEKIDFQNFEFSIIKRSKQSVLLVKLVIKKED
ncbi:MAG: hemolysin family protein [Cytophagaceae bacterium]|jgi:CBS domain containing-hemolysin-like protein|nr:hemolysin family protein [Cytophagaceae bacterium]